ncbi:Exportin-6 [Phytophthora nicotianae]|uniref:Exportin-6 n=2 Tax=Phytophthora nicotianae TaxID=4792 RepID=A0A0W8D2Q2_PHYNI|nr:hypothetical protein F444_07226 [Phytophthora nicotianae P1976]KUF90644.1 Exportin-6 [Phytophthora nicotianae]
MGRSKPPGRPRITGQGRTKPTHRRRCTTNRLKLEIVEYFFECNKRMQKTVDKYFSTLSSKSKDSKRKLIYTWIENHETLKLLCEDPKTADLKYLRPVGVATILSAEAEQELVGWVNMLRKDGVPVSGPMLEMQALEIAAEHDVLGFKASWHWRKGFLRRHQLSLRARTRQGKRACLVGDKDKDLSSDDDLADDSESDGEDNE